VAVLTVWGFGPLGMLCESVLSGLFGNVLCESVLSDLFGNVLCESILSDLFGNVLPS
jgi:hypothetical protein